MFSAYARGCESKCQQTETQTESNTNVGARESAVYVSSKRDRKRRSAVFAAATACVHICSCMRSTYIAVYMDWLV